MSLRLSPRTPTTRDVVYLSLDSHVPAPSGRAKLQKLQAEAESHIAASFTSDPEAYRGALRELSRTWERLALFGLGSPADIERVADFTRQAVAAFLKSSRSAVTDLATLTALHASLTARVQYVTAGLSVLGGQDQLGDLQLVADDLFAQHVLCDVSVRRVVLKCVAEEVDRLRSEGAEREEKAAGSEGRLAPSDALSPPPPTPPHHITRSTTASDAPASVPQEIDSRLLLSLTAGSEPSPLPAIVSPKLIALMYRAGYALEDFLGREAVIYYLHTNIVLTDDVTESLNEVLRRRVLEQQIMQSILGNNDQVAKGNRAKTDGNATQIGSMDVTKMIDLVIARAMEAATKPSPYMAPFDTQVIRNRVLPYIVTQFERCVRTYDSTALRTAYILLSFTQQADQVLLEKLAQFVKDEGVRLLTTSGDAVTAIAALISFKRRIFALSKASFSPKALETLSSAFDAMLTSIKGGGETKKRVAKATPLENNTEQKDNGERGPALRPAEMLARFVDHLMRGKRSAFVSIVDVVDGSVSHTETTPLPLVASSSSQAEKTAPLDMTEDILFMFRHMQDKDLFEAFYRKDLARRLLLGTSASVDAERLLLRSLGSELGDEFVSKVEFMFTDVAVSAELTAAFKRQGGMLRMNVLSTANWPTYEAKPAILTPALAAELEAFKRFYTAQFAGRTLRHVPALDTCVLKDSAGPREFDVSLHQALVLLAFNDAQRLSYADVAAATGLADGELRRTLQSLACGRVRVLRKSPKGRDVAPTDAFALNATFTHPAYRIRINQIQEVETVQEQAQTTHKVITDRAQHISLAIVRVMKGAKVLKYNELVMQIVNELKSRFNVETSDIKKSIDSLIEREYIKRSEKAANVFEYVA